VSLVSDFSELPTEGTDAEVLAEETTIAAPLAEDVYVDEAIEEAAEEPVEVVEAEEPQVEVVEELVDEVVEAEAEVVTAEEFLDEAAEAGDDEEEDEPVRVESPYDRPGQWFVIHSYSGYEKKVKSNLESRIASMNMEDRIYEVVIPEEDVVELKNGRKVTVTKKMFPGYLLVRCELDDDSWYVVRNTPGVTGFVGNGARPTPLSRKEVENVLGVGKEEPGVEKKVRPRLEFEEGEQVRVITGPFADFNGAISDIDVARSKLTVLVNIFGRETPVELELGQVAKL